MRCAFRITNSARWTAVLVASLVLCPAAARDSRAEELPPASTRGFEARLSGSVGIFTELASRVEGSENYGASPLAGVGLEDQPSLGFNAELAYRVHPHVSVSAHAEYLSDLSVEVGEGLRAGPEAGNRLLSGETWTLTGDVRLFPLTSGTFQPFLVVGAGWMWAETADDPVVRSAAPAFEDPELIPIDSGIGDRNAFVARAGGGVDVLFTDSFFVTAQASYVFATGRLADFDYVSVAWGFGYRF